jgi:hypothetical protein
VNFVIFVFKEFVLVLYSAQYARTVISVSAREAMPCQRPTTLSWTLFKRCFYYADEERIVA